IGVNGINSMIQVAEKITNSTLPHWNPHIPFVPKNPPGVRGEKAFVYFPSCISRQLGVPIVRHQVSGSPIALSEALVIISDRASIHLHTPKDISGTCCGTHFHSKGYKQAYQLSLHKIIMQMWKWSEHGKYPIVVDTSSCTLALRTCKDDLNSKDREIWKQLTILDSLEFLRAIILPKLEIHPTDEDVILHPNCSARKLGLDSTMLNIADRKST